MKRPTNAPNSVLTTVALTIAAIFITGCDSQPQCYPISGTVKFADDSTAQFGNIEFRSTTEPPTIARGKINKNGTFTARSSGGRIGLLAGKHKVIIVQIIGNSRGGGTVVHHHGLEVATKYNDYRTSDLEIEVTPDGKNEFELIVDSKDD